MRPSLLYRIATEGLFAATRSWPLESPLPNGRTFLDNLAVAELVCIPTTVLDVMNDLYVRHPVDVLSALREGCIRLPWPVIWLDIAGVTPEGHRGARGALCFSHPDKPAVVVATVTETSLCPPCTGWPLIFLGCDATGTPDGTFSGHALNQPPPEHHQAYIEHQREYACAVIASLTFLHTKNIKTVDSTERMKPRIAKRLGRAKDAQVRWKELVVTPITTHGKSRSKGPEAPIPLHACRGHFKIFTPAKPLFGKLVGRYWWPFHMRGEADYGTIVKTYRLASA